MFGESMQTLRIVVAVLVLATISKAWISGFKNRKFNNAVRSTVCMSKMIPLDQEPPLKILLLVEPTPFNYISGYANRFKEMLNYLAIAGDKVAILTPDPTKNPPKQYNGFPITSVRGFEFVLYNQVTLSFDLRFNIPKLIKEFQPDLIHVSTPSALICPAVVWAKLYNIPLVMSYHTHFPEYAKAYASQLPGSLALANWLVKLYHDCADLTLCTSPQLKQQLESAGIRRVDVWQKGINTKVFSPKYKSSSMRERLSQGNVDAPLLLYVGRLGSEKKIERLQKVLDAVPTARLALVGGGPAEDDLKKLFKDYPVHFTGQLTGTALSEAYASSDIFVMPSDSETLGFVAIESLASGVPVVAVAAGGLVDLIDDGTTGYLAENNDNMKDFVEKVKILVADKGKRDNYSTAAVQWAAGWSWEAATSKLRNVQYRNAISLHRARDDRYLHIEDIEKALMNHYSAE